METLIFKWEKAAQPSTCVTESNSLNIRGKILIVLHCLYSYFAPKEQKPVGGIYLLIKKKKPSKKYNFLLFAYP